MEPRKLTKQELQKESAWLEAQAKLTSDYKQEELASMLAGKFEEKQRDPAHVDRDASTPAGTLFFLNRAKSEITTLVSGMGKLKKYNAVIIGPAGPARDGTADEVSRVQDIATKGGINKVYAMANAREIAAIPIMKDSGQGPKEVLAPVRKLLAPMVKTKDNKWEVQRWLDKAKTKPGYELWTGPADPVVPLDTNAKSRFDEKKDNTDKGRELRPNWSMSFHVIVWEEGEEMPRHAQFTVYGEDAVPGSKNFIGGRAEAEGWYMRPVMLKCDENEKKSTDRALSLKPGSGSKYVIKPLPKEGFDMYNVINGKYPIVGMPSWTKDPFDKVMPPREVVIGDRQYVPPIPQIDLANIREYHEKFQMKLDEEMKPILNTRGKHKGEQGVNYDQIAYIECTIALKKEPDPESEGSIIVEVKDNSLAEGRFSCFLPRMYQQLPFTHDVADVGMFVTTKKSNDFYDKDLHARVKDDGSSGVAAGTKGDIGMSAVNLFIIEERDLPDSEKKEVPKSDEKAAAEQEMKV